MACLFLLLSTNDSSRVILQRHGKDAWKIQPYLTLPQTLSIFALLGFPLPSAVKYNSYHFRAL